MTLAALREVAVAYPKRGRALGPFSLELEAGAITALVGASGCGKSTALRLLAGLEQPTEGEAVRDLARGETSVVFQAPTLAPWLSALDNAALPLRLAGLDPKAARERAAEALTRVGLSASLGARPAHLSGGMAMRVSLARALVTEPKLLLLDEPFAALDEIIRRDLADDVLKLWAASRPAIVFVTHSVEEAVYMASRVVVMTRGPGRLAADIAVGGDLPRPPGFRTTAGFRQTVEQVSAALAQGMSA